MPTYKKPCMYCAQFIPGESNVCPFCGMMDPFAMRCPKCRKEVETSYKVCPGCGFPLAIKCPKCGEMVFPRSTCEKCGASMTRVCPNKKCNETQIYINEKCWRCGKRMDK